MSSSNNNHIAIVGIDNWSHNRALCTLAARLVHLRPVIITYFTYPRLYEKVLGELSRNLDAGEDITTRIRVIALEAHPVNPFDLEIVTASFAEQYPKCVKGEPMRCAKADTDVPAWHPPKTVLFDLFAYRFMRIARSTSTPAPIQMLMWLSAPLAALHQLVGPLGPDTIPNFQGKIEETVKRTGQTLMEAAQGLLYTPLDEVMKLPGFPPMYNYELYPQKMAFTIPSMGLLLMDALNLLNECDGIITSTSVVYESQEAIQNFEDYFAKTGRAGKLHIVGPLLPQSTLAADLELEQGSKSLEIMAFMDKVLETRGKQSIVYISFGTLFWTTEPEKVWTVFDVLIEKNIPFLFSHASAFSTVPEEIVNKVQAAGLGMIVPWVPQQTVLAHPATGWFLTHGGFNSLTESINSGVPLICWPFSAEQPLNAIHVTENLGISYELLEVRNGAGVKPIYRTGKAPSGTLDALRAEVHAVLDKAFGEDGQKKREKTLRLRDASRKLWDDGGASRLSAEQFLDSL